ncbi:zinc finger protein 235-like [Saccostrea cucullata]|uniref:zinc finger protein 235-like n=1 Tax=Saccostrea cuccullata TaxID=36930 RepID=UPI002ED09A89
MTQTVPCAIYSSGRDGGETRTLRSAYFLWKLRQTSDAMLDDSDTTRLEIRKGKFVFKLAVKGNSETLPKFLKQEQDLFTEKNPVTVDKCPVTDRYKDSGEGGSDTDSMCGFPPIQVCQSHPGAWKSSNLNFIKNENEVVEQRVIQNDGCIIHGDGYTNTNNEAEVVIETKPFELVIDPVDGVVNPTCDIGDVGQCDDVGECEYEYILDSDDSRCQSPVMNENLTDINNVEITNINGENDYRIRTECALENMKNCDNHGSNGSIDKLPVSGDCKKDNTEQVQLAGSIVHRDKMEGVDDGNETETEFEPLEGDEWEGMKTKQSNVTSGSNRNDVDKSPRATGGATDEECSSDDDDLISQYVTYMPREISRSVNSKRRAARELPTSATYRRCSSELSRYFCEKCGISYKSFSDYQTHKRTHKENKCEVCFKQFKNTNGLLKHSNIHTGDNLSTCSFCRKTFNYKKNLYHHIHKKHLSHLSYEKVTEFISAKYKKSPSSKSKKPCSGKPETEGSKEKETSIVKSVISSQQVDNTQKRKEILLKECSVCIKKFEPRILERHMRSHTGERPHACDLCPFRCSQLGNLNKHKANVHQKKDGDQILRYKCDKCEKRFYDKAHLRRHDLTHFEKSVKHYECSVCKKPFRFDSGLQRHMQLHKDGLKISCGICNRQFYDSSGLKKHLEQHTSQLPYRCETCQCSFGSIHALRRHKVSHTGTKRSHPIKTPRPSPAIKQTMENRTRTNE